MKLLRTVLFATVVVTAGLASRRATGQGNPGAELLDAWKYPNIIGGDVAARRRMHWSSFYTQDKVQKVHDFYKEKMEQFKQTAPAPLGGAEFLTRIGAGFTPGGVAPRTEPTNAQLLLRTAKQTIAIEMFRIPGEKEATHGFIMVNEHCGEH